MKLEYNPCYDFDSNKVILIRGTISFILKWELNKITIHIMRGSRGGAGGVRTPPPPIEFAKLNIADITGNEKKEVIFHICALPQLYFKQNQSYLRLDPPPPGKNFWNRAWILG